jgi:hypothetical protein
MMMMIRSGYCITVSRMFVRQPPIYYKARQKALRKIAEQSAVVAFYLFFRDTSELDGTHSNSALQYIRGRAIDEYDSEIAGPRKAVDADQRKHILDPGSTLKAATSLARYGQGRTSGDLT